MMNGNPFMNIQQLMSEYNNFLQNPVQWLAKRNVPNPQQAMQNPQQAVQGSMGNGNMNNQQFNQIMSMAQMMLLMDMCERRGSGIDRATDAISRMKLPAYKAQSGDDFTRITLFPKKKVSEMTREERIAVCYQYTCLLYEDGQAINNQTVRERFNLNKNQTVMASRILADTLESGLIKMKDPETDSLITKSIFQLSAGYCRNWKIDRFLTFLTVS